MHQGKKQITNALTLVLLLTVPCLGGTIYSSLGSTGSLYDPDNLFNISGSTSSNANLVSFAFSFTAAESGSVSSVDLAMDLVSGDNAFRLAFYDGVPLAGGSLIGNELDFSAAPNSSDCCDAMVNVSGIGGIDLAVGQTYYLWITPQTPAGTAFGRIFKTSTAATSDQRLYFNELTFTVSEGQTAAFAVNSAAVETPEPAAFTLLGLGLICIYWFRHANSSERPAPGDGHHRP